ncbi:MAG: HAMP domain-containing histidine kinase [Chitinophagaceae bacterium]|nr:HAMP domain-containing histidine kinase [Chitinophagaceae bacterium]
MRSAFILLLLFLSYTLPCSSQDPAKFHIQQFNTENGLPSNGIKGLQWDEETGFLWIGTEAGVVRYNGMEFKVYGKEDNPHIVNERILFVVKNNAGKVFTADYTGNIFHLQKNKLVFDEKKQLFNNPNNNMVSIAVSEALYKTDVDFSKTGPYSLQFDKMLALGDTASFVVHMGRLFYYSQTIRQPVQVSPANMVINSGFKADTNFFVRERQNAIYLLERPFGRFTPVHVRNEVTGDILDDPYNVFIWENGRSQPLLFNKQKAWSLRYEEGELKARLICDQVPENILIKFAFYHEKRKTLFIGTDSKGVVIITANKVETLRKENTDPNQRTSYYAQVELTGGNILTNEGHVIGKSLQSVQKLPVERKFSNSVFLTGDSLLWFTQTRPPLPYSYLHKYSYKTRRTYVFEKIRMVNENVVAASLGQTYVADNNGIFRLNGDTLQEVYHHPQDGFSRIHFDMQETEPGVLIIATCNSLLRFDTRTGLLDTIFNAGNYCVRAIWQYENNIFIGTYGGGLFLYKNGKVRALPLDKNKYLLFTHCFVKDDAGYCWISSNKGLFKTSLRELIGSFDNDTASVYYYYFGQNDGMDMTELNGGCTPCALLKKDKIISFPSMDGLLWVDPENAIPDLPEGEIYIDQFSADAVLLNPDSIHLLKLPEQTTEIIIKPGFSAWCHKENIYIDYRLNNEKEWRPVNIDRGMEIRFSNLPQGDYKLLIRKRNGFGKEDYSYKELVFHISIPWYKRWWFYLLCLVAAFGLVALYLQVRTRQYKIRQRKLEQQVAEKTKELQEQNEILEKNNSIKTRLISIISHDIVTPLKFLTVAGKNLLEKRKQMPEELQQETIQEMTNTSQELQLLSTNILNWIKYQNENRRLTKEIFNLYEMVSQVLGILNSLAQQKGLRIVNAIDKESEIYQFYEPVKILVYNLLTNAINFSEKGTISVSTETKNNVVIISVKDEGVGMTPEKIQSLMADHVVISSANVDNRKGHGLGFLIIKDLLKTVGATLNIESRPGAGSTISIIIPE